MGRYLNPSVLIWATFLCLDFLLEASANSGCPYAHPQEQFCAADFAVRATMKKTIFSRYNNQSGVTERKYKFRVGEMFKPDPSDIHAADLLSIDISKLIQKFYFYDLIMQPEVEYFFTGYFGAGGRSLKVDKCSWVVEWGELTRMQYRGIKNRFIDNCMCRPADDCMSATGNYTNCNPSTEDLGNPHKCDTGSFRGNFPRIDCFNRHAGCFLTSSKKSCRWRTDEEYMDYCLNKIWLNTKK